MQKVLLNMNKTQRMNYVKNKKLRQSNKILKRINYQEEDSETLEGRPSLGILLLASMFL